MKVSEDLVKSAYEGSIEGEVLGGPPTVRWIIKMDKCLWGGVDGVRNCADMMCQNLETRDFDCDNPFWRSSLEEAEDQRQRQAVQYIQKKNK